MFIFFSAKNFAKFNAYPDGTENYKPLPPV